MQTKDPLENSALSRRAFVGKLAVGAAVASAVSAGSAAALTIHSEIAGSSDPLLGDAPAAAALAAPDTAAIAAPAPWELLHPLAQGSTVSNGWRVADLSAATEGSCVLTLQNARGRSYRVHICRNAGSPQGLVYTEQFDLVVMNGGQGDLPSEEGMAQAVAEVAHVLAANQASAAPVITALRPHAERVDRFAAAGKLR